MLVTLFASLGTPMLLGGDEFGRTQQGNNNAYCQDNEISWFDWRLARRPEGRALLAFTARLIALRTAYPLLRASRFLYGQDEVAPGLLDIDWFDERGRHLSADDWANAEGRALMMRRAARTTKGSVEAISLLLNASSVPLTFHFAPPHEIKRRLLIDSADPDASEHAIKRASIVVKERAALLIRGEMKAPP